MMAYLVKQIYNIVNDAVADALGENASATNLDSSDIVSLGRAISEFDAYEGFFNSLAAVAGLIFIVFFIQKANVDAMNRDDARKTAINAMYYALEEGFYAENGKLRV